jgi:hypothetical protein
MKLFCFFDMHKYIMIETYRNDKLQTCVYAIGERYQCKYCKKYKYCLSLNVEYITVKPIKSSHLYISEILYEFYKKGSVLNKKISRTHNITDILH